MRISNNIMYSRFLLNIRDNISSMYREQEKIGSGKRINRLSDDPVGIYKAMGFRDRIRLIDQYRKNANEAETVLTASETAISGAETGTTRAYELAIQYANGIADRMNGVNELEEVRDEIVSLANKKVGSRYIFGGYLTGAPPYAETLMIRTGVNDQIVFNDGGPANVTITLPSGIYTPEQLNKELKTLLEAANGSTDTYDVSFDYSTDRFQVANDAENTNTLALNWSDLASTAASTLGFEFDDSVAVGSSAVADKAVTFERGFEVTASNNVFMADLGDGDGLAAVTLTANTYTTSELAAEIQTQLETEDGDAGNTYSVTYNSVSQTFSIANGAGNNQVTLAWANEATTAGSLLGFSSSDVTLDAGDLAESSNPAELSARYVYQGDSGSIDIEIADGVSSTINIPGNDIFDSILTAMDGFITSMRRNDLSGISSAIGDIQNGGDSLLNARARIGARLNRVDQERLRMDEEFVVISTALSGVEDTDMIESVIEISKLETSMEALRITGFEMLSRSLFDFLR